MKGYQTLPEERCGDCEHFRKHYIRMTEDYYHETNYGHCVHPRLKNRRAEEHCPHWTPAKEEEAQFQEQ